MKKLLLIGATGQLGSKILEKLAQNPEYSIRILVREDSKYQHLEAYQPEVVIGDLKDYHSIKRAVQGCNVVITTANSAAPRKKEDSFESVDTKGYQFLIDEAKRRGVEHFIYTSAIPASEKMQKWIPLNRAKASTERYLKASGLPYTIIQPDTFMDVYFTFMGTSIPVKNEPAALVDRPFGFMQKFYNGIKDDIENGKIGIIGDGNARHHYIAIDNVADFIVKAVEAPQLRNKSIPIGGPESLSGLEVKALFEKVLNKPLKIKKTPAVMMKIMGNVFSLFNEGASNILKLNYWAATNSTKVDCRALAEELGIELIKAEDYLKGKLEMMESPTGVEG